MWNWHAPFLLPHPNIAHVSRCKGSSFRKVNECMALILTIFAFPIFMKGRWEDEQAQDDLCITQNPQEVHPRIDRTFGCDFPEEDQESVRVGEQKNERHSTIVVGVREWKTGDTDTKRQRQRYREGMRNKCCDYTNTHGEEGRE